MKNVFNIMKLDLVAVRAKKFSPFKVFIAAFIIFALTGLFIPLLLLPFMFALGFVTVPSFLDTEDRNEGELTLSLLPVTRREIVIARYGLVTLALTVTGAAALLVLKLSQVMCISDIFDTSSSGAELSEILSLKMDDFGLISLLICTFAAIALIFSASQLSGFFRNGKNKSGKSALRALLIYFIFWVVLGVIIAAEASSLDVKILSSALSVAGSLFMALSAPYNGALLCVFILMIAYGYVFYKAACSVIDYESREL